MSDRDGRENTEDDDADDFFTDSDAATAVSMESDDGSCRMVHNSAKNSMGERFFMIYLSDEITSM